MRSTPLATFASCWFLVVMLPPAALPAQTLHEVDVRDYEKRKHDELFEASQRHLRLGSWCRKQKLVPQATAEFLRAVEVGEGHNEGATTVLNLMRGYGPAFWRGNRAKPSKNLLDGYQKQRQEIEAATRRARVQLALHAFRIGLRDEAKAQCLAVLNLGDAALELRADGKVALERALLPTELGEWVAAQTIPLQNGARVFEAVATRAGGLDGLVQVESEALVVRSQLGEASAKKLHRAATALLPHLEARLAGRPARRLGVLVIASRPAYETYLKETGSAAFAAAPGVAEYGTGQTVACAEGLAEADLHALVLHELTHVWFHGVVPAAMPDWYAEGLAETFGGQGTFAWDGDALKVGGTMRRDRIDDAKQAPLPLRELLDGDCLQLLAKDRALGRRFYVQAWAFLRFLSNGDHAWRAPFQQWEAQCRGAALGAFAGKPLGDETAARKLFSDVVATDVDALERAFLAWLAEL